MDNLLLSRNLRGLARMKSRKYVTETISRESLKEFMSNGWDIDKKNRKSVRVKKDKEHDVLLKDRVWTLLYKLGFDYINNEKPVQFILDSTQAEVEKTIDIVSVDNEIALAVQCISSKKLITRSDFQDEIAEYSLVRERFSKIINSYWEGDTKRQVVLLLCTSNIVVTEMEHAMASKRNIVLIDDKELAYYESLVSHLGPAAKYQFLADLLPGRKVTGLSVKVPAVRTKMGGTNCYTFSITPEYLLKIAYVSHRAKGRNSDVISYQRMVNKTRLNKIKDYISDNGIFPTNIVLNFDKDKSVVQFQRASQEQNVDPDNGVVGWLEIKPTYKSAWIIDGQHRLFAYSGHPKATTSLVSVLAFEGLDSSKQAQLFVDVNAKQKSVKQSLLQELYAELHQDADEPIVRLRAILSQAVQVLGTESNSPLYERIQVSDDTKDAVRCISLVGIFGALEKNAFHISKTKSGSPVEFGPLWAGTNEATIKRTVYILKGWLNCVRERNQEWWDRGAAEGGGLAMNDGIITCIKVLRSVFEHLEISTPKLTSLENEELFNLIRPFGDKLGEYLCSLTVEERKRFRDLRGAQGQTARTRKCQQALREKFSDFNPSGLDEFIRLELAQTNSRAKEVIDWLETEMQKVIQSKLQEVYGPTENGWWIQGVPTSVRKKASERYEDDKGGRGNRYHYLDLLDYHKIVTDKWKLFEPIFGYGKKGNKEERTQWLIFVNEKRKLVAHASAGKKVTIEELDKLNIYKEWLSEKIENYFDSDTEIEFEPSV